MTKYIKKKEIIKPKPVEEVKVAAPQKTNASNTQKPQDKEKQKILNNSYLKSQKSNEENEEIAKLGIKFTNTFSINDNIDKLFKTDFKNSKDSSIYYKELQLKRKRDMQNFVRLNYKKGKQCDNIRERPEINEKSKKNE